ncbi:BON domain protein [compost metagenome]
MRKYSFVFASAVLVLLPGVAGANYIPSKYDKTLESKVLTVVRAQPLGNSDFSVQVHRGHVLLVGKIASPEMGQSMADAISATPGVYKVHNELKPGARGDRSADRRLANEIDAVIHNSGIAGPKRIAMFVIEGNAYLLGGLTRAESKQVVSAIQQKYATSTALKKIIMLFDYYDVAPGVLTVKGCQLYLGDNPINKNETVTWNGRCVKGLAEGDGLLSVVFAGGYIKGDVFFERGALTRGNLHAQLGSKSGGFSGGIFNMLPHGEATVRRDGVETVGTFYEGEMQRWTTATNLTTGEVIRYGESWASPPATEAPAETESSGFGGMLGGLLQGAGQAMQAMGGSNYGKGILIEGIGGAVSGDEEVANSSMQALNSGAASTAYGPGIAAAQGRKGNCRYTPSGSVRGCVIPNMNHCLTVQPGRNGEMQRVNGCAQSISVFACSSGQGQRSANAVAPLCATLVNPSNSRSVPSPLLYSVGPGGSVPVSATLVSWACPFGSTEVLQWDGRTLATVCYETGLITDNP